MLEDEVQEGVHRMQSGSVKAHLTERFADDRLIRAGNNLGVEEVPVPHPHAELGVVVLTEAATVFLVPQQGIALDLVAEVQGGGTGAEFLEHHQVDAVGVHLERHRQVLPAEVGTESVHHPGQRPEQRDGEGVGLDVGGRQQAGLQLAAPHRK